MRLRAQQGLTRSRLRQRRRDEALILAWIRDADPADAQLRNALVVALGMLGSPPPVEVGWPDPTDVDQGRADFVAVALSEDDPRVRVDLATEAEIRAGAGTYQLAQTALMRIEDGVRLAVVD